MSVSSNGSCLSINYEGKEMGLEEMLDKTIGGIQKHLNDVQMQLRQCAQSDDRNDSYEEITEFTDAIEDDVDSMIELFADLKTVATQIRGKPPDPESKKWFEEHKQKRKEQKQKEKLEKKQNSKIKVTKLETMPE